MSEKLRELDNIEVASAAIDCWNGDGYPKGISEAAENAIFATIEEFKDRQWQIEDLIAHRDLLVNIENRKQAIDKPGYR